MTEGQILLESFLQALAAGALVGAIYGLMCVGLAMIFGIMRVINFAQGDFMMLGMYIAFYAFTLLGVQAAFGGIFGLHHRAGDPVGHVLHQRILRDRRARRPMTEHVDRDAMNIAAPMVGLLRGTPTRHHRTHRHHLVE